MKKAFVCSFCHKGILGGGLFVTDEAITYKTGKVTVEKRYREFTMRFEDISSISWKWLVFPFVTIRMKNSAECKFLVYNIKGFMKAVKR